jgi:hypothetical protein
MTRQIKAALKNAGNRSIKQICLKQLTGILNLDSLVKKTRQPTEKNDLQEVIEDETRTRKLPSCQIGIRSSMILCKQMVVIFLSNIDKYVT